MIRAASSAAWVLLELGEVREGIGESRAGRR